MLPRDLFGDVRLNLNVSLICEVVQVLDFASVVELDIHFAGRGSNMRGNAYLRPELAWRVETVEPLESSALAR